MDLIVTLHGKHAATLDASDESWLHAGNTTVGPMSASISAAWTEQPATRQLNCWLDGCLPENGLLGRYRARAQAMMRAARVACKTPTVPAILWANADAEFAGAIRFDTERTRSTAQTSGYERLTEAEIGRRLDEADRIARGFNRGRKLPDVPEGIALSGMRGKIGLTMLEDGSWGAACGQALNTWVAKVEDNPRLPGESGIEAICQRAFAVLGIDSAVTASQIFDGVQSVLSLGVTKGDERRVAGVDHRTGTVTLEGPEGQSIPWRPRQVGAKRGAVEVYRTESMELRAGDRIRWTRNDTGLGLVNSDAAEVAAVRGNRIAFRLGDGQTLELGRDDPQMRDLDHAWASTVHAFQGRTVDNVIAVMEAKPPKLSTQKSFYVEISRARHNAELVTDDAKALCETLEAATGERVSALEGVGAAEKALAEEKARGGGKERGNGLEGLLERPAGTRDEAADKGREPEQKKVPEPERAAELDKIRGSRGIEMEM